jgi:pilus assembly protein FimV
MNGIRKIPLAVALALGAGQAWALGLGAIEVRSALNEPLEAEILLTSADAEELASLQVKLASPEDFQRVGLARGLVTVPLEFAVGRNARGQPVIKLSSKAPVRDPFLSILIDAQWTGGRMLREYTLLLDPPLTAPAVRGTVAATPARVPEAPPSRVERLQDDRPPVERAPAERPRPVTEPSRPAVAPAPEAPRPAPPAYAGEEYGPVAEGETLWVIARNTRPDEGISVNQMMMALYQANPQAFINNNINLLRRGAILRIPGADEVRAISSAEAAQLVARQHEQWREARADRPLPRIEPADPVPTRPAPRPEPSRPAEDRLALLPPADERRRDPGESRPGVSVDAAEVEGLRADLQLSRENLAAAEQELRELRGRVRDLESLQSRSERLIELKDAELAELQRRLAELQAQLEAAGVESLAEVPAPGAEPGPDSLEPAPETPAAEVAETVEAARPGDPFVLLDPPREAAETERPAPRPRERAQPAPAPTPAPPPPPPPAEPWYTSPYVLGGIAVVMAVLLAVVARRRRGSQEARSGSSLASRLVTASAGGATPAAAANADPAEALQAAVNADPSNLDAHLALLRYRFEQGDAEGFEADAETMSGFVTDTSGPEWDEVRMMGAEIAPEHPLFRDTSPQSPVAPEPDFAEDFDFGDSAGAQATAQDEAAPDRGGAEAFAIDLGGAEEIAIESEAGDFEPTFEPGPRDEEPQPVVDTYSTQRIAAIDLEHAVGDGPRDEGLSLDSGGDDAVATKLDLAREYLDLGDPEGARSLLEEVLKEGSSAQKAEAQRLMVQIR